MSKSNLVTRVLTAIPLGATIIGCILYNSISFDVLLALIAFFCFYEYQQICLPSLNTSQRIFFASIVVITLIANLYIPKQARWSLGFSLSIFLLTVLFIMYQMRSDHKKTLSNGSLFALGLVYILVPLRYFHIICNESDVYKPAIALGIFLLIWAGDIFAYFIGKNFGKNLIAPLISPKKTWEGSIGGITGIIIIAFSFNYFKVSLLFSEWVIIGIIIWIFGTLGDFFESALKRSVGIKDSGTILPGHGGFLDRFDSMLFAVPVIALYFQWFK